MNASDFYRKAVKHYLKKIGMTQKELARRLNETAPHVNSFLKGERNFSEERKEKLAQIMGTTYIDLLNMGRDLADTERPLHKKPPQTHDQIIKRFKDKKTAENINFMLVEIEHYDPERYKQAGEFISWLHQGVKAKKTVNE
ncbi:MAG: helix-turn-helix transcriptional regulator [Thermodesulfobacteriota bacterium]|nr:helix-turn-helix transcriptional regulator [Thermodesulfobacteriota bacterium]